MVHLDSTKTNKMIATETKKKTTIHTSIGANPTLEKNIPENQVWIDDAFYVIKTRFGLHTSVLKEPILGAHFITGLEEKDVIEVTRWHLKALQDGSLDDNTKVVNDGKVGGKL